MSDLAVDFVEYVELFCGEGECEEQEVVSDINKAGIICFDK